MAGTSPAMTPEKWFDMTGIRSKSVIIGAPEQHANHLINLQIERFDNRPP